MAENTSIEWCDHTFNPWSGCTKVSPGCAHCYAESLSKRNPATLGVWGKGQPRKRMSEAYWRQPLKWNETGICVNCGYSSTRTEGAHRAPDGGWCGDHDGNGGIAQTFRRPRVFCASLADWLDDEVPIEWLADLLDLIRRTPNLDWLLLSKRPENWRDRLMAAANYLRDKTNHVLRETCQWISDWVQWNKPPANVWIGTTVEDQTRADERIPLLLSIPAKVRFLSCEPLLGPVTLALMYCPDCCTWTASKPVNSGKDVGCFHCGTYKNQWFMREQGIHWVICGGESGPGARPMHPDWARSLRDQCVAAGVPFLFKQWGEWLPARILDAGQFQVSTPRRDARTTQARVRPLEGPLSR